MKVRVKATGEIVEIAEYSTIYAENYDTCFYPSQLEFLDNSEDYWTRLEHQYAGMAMQGMLSCKDFVMELGNMKGMSTEDALAKAASTIAHALVEKMKEERK